jgi:protein SCO1/2
MSEIPPRTWVAAAVVLGGVSAAAVTLWAYPDLVSRFRQTGLYAAADPACDLGKGPCTATFPDGRRVTLEITPRGLPTEEPLTARVQVDPPGPAPVWVELQGDVMNMGLLRAPLVEGVAGWTGTVVVPLCTTERMTWRADVVLADRTAGFGFEVTKKELPPAPVYGDFTLTGASGPLGLADLRGQVVVVYFGYTSCPDFCPTTLQTIASAFRSLSPNEQEQVTGLMVSLDPGRDTPAHLAEYTGWYHPRIRAVTGSDAEVADVAARWGVAWRKVPLEGSALGYALDHDTRAFLVAPDGHVVGFVRHGTSAESLVRQIRGLM